MLLPFSAATYCSFSSEIASPPLAFAVTILPDVPVNVSFHFSSSPASPVLSSPQNPIKLDAKLLFG